MFMPRHANHIRRGFAMMMVLISLAVATILATAYLASRDNSAMIGQNVSSGSSAKWAALATLKSGLAVLETETDWRNNHTAGVVFTNTPLAGATVELVFMDRVTGNPPTDDTTEVKVVATAEVNGMEETVVAYAIVPSAENDPDVDLSEFAVFGTDSITVTDTSIITRWYTAPKGERHQHLALGTLNTAPGAIALSGYAVAVNSTAYAVASASNMVLSNSGPGAINLVKLPDIINVPDAPDAGSTAPSGGTFDMYRNASAPTGLTIDRRYNDITCLNGSLLRLRDMTLTADDDIIFDSGSILSIYGDVKIVVHDTFRFFSDARIEMQPNSTLTLFVGNEFEFSDADVREAGDSSTRDLSGNAPWLDPRRVSLYELDSRTVNWEIDDTAAFIGTVYAPNKNVDVDDGSALYGAVVARDVDLYDASAVYYDHTLNTRNGYTETEGPVYTNDGEVHPAIEVLDSLDLPDVAAAKDAVRGDQGPPATAGPGQPTPRTVDITYEIETFSHDIDDWESKATQISAAPEDDDDDDDDGGGLLGGLWGWLFG